LPDGEVEGGLIGWARRIRIHSKLGGCGGGGGGLGGGGGGGLAKSFVSTSEKQKSRTKVHFNSTSRTDQVAKKQGKKSLGDS